MSKTYKGDVTGNVVELNLLDAIEGTLPNLGTPTVVTKSTGPNVVEQFVGDIPANQYVAGSNGGYSVKGLVLGTSCTIINTFAFDSCFGLTGNLVIPDSVTSIGDYAFFTCNSLTGDLTIPDSVTSIGGGAFRECAGFDDSLTIGNSVTSIGSQAFYNCSGLTGPLTIPDSVTSIGFSAFDGCSGLTAAYINCPASSWTGTNALQTTTLLTNIYVHADYVAGYDASWKTAQNTTATVSTWTNYPNIP